MSDHCSMAVACSSTHQCCPAIGVWLPCPCLCCITPGAVKLCSAVLWSVADIETVHWTVCMLSCRWCQLSGMVATKHASAWVHSHIGRAAAQDDSPQPPCSLCKTALCSTLSHLSSGACRARARWSQGHQGHHLWPAAEEGDDSLHARVVPAGRAVLCLFPARLYPADCLLRRRGLFPTGIGPCRRACALSVFCRVCSRIWSLHKIMCRGGPLQPTGLYLAHPTNTCWGTQSTAKLRQSCCSATSGLEQLPPG